MSCLRSIDNELTFINFSLRKEKQPSFYTHVTTNAANHLVFNSYILPSVLLQQMNFPCSLPRPKLLLPPIPSHPRKTFCLANIFFLLCIKFSLSTRSFPSACIHVLMSSIVSIRAPAGNWWHRMRTIWGVFIKRPFTKARVGCRETWKIGSTMRFITVASLPSVGP